MSKRECEKHSPFEDDKRENFSKMVIEEADVVCPIIMEQLFKECIIGFGDLDDILNIYCKTFGFDADMRIRMFDVCPMSGSGTDNIYFIKSIVYKSIGKQHIVAAAEVEGHIIAVTDIVEKRDFLAAADKIHRLVRTCYKTETTVVYSDEASLREVQILYGEISRSSAYSFYTSDKRTVCSGEVRLSTRAELKPDYGEIEKAVNGGDTKKSSKLLNCFFDRLCEAAPLPSIAKTYCLELYVCIIRCCDANGMDKYMKGIVSVRDGETLDEIRQFISAAAEEIAERNSPANVRIYSSLIKETLDIIENNIANENLSLRWIAGSVLYTNVDYLGKLFKRETGKNFSHYVMEKRMEKAKRLITEGKKDKIYEIAEKVGYGTNPQYFSQVFKKYTGISPLEYKEAARTAAR